MYPGNQKREQKGPKRTKKRPKDTKRDKKDQKRPYQKGPKRTKGDKKGVLHCYKITGKVISDNLDAFFSDQIIDGETSSAI